MDCYACHQTDFENTNDPNHIQAGFSTDCSECHTTAGWGDANFDHNQTQFPLTGQHISVDCSACHVSGYSNTPMDCYACHQTDYENANDPNHVAQGYPTDCTQCHTTAGWDGANFDHNLTAFPLTGAHSSTQCISCHANGYQGTPTDCYSCHSENFNNTTDPNHQTSGFPHTCDDCHTTSAWTPANFDHNFYPTGNSHNNVTCNECHSEANYQPQCLSCHQDDFNEGHNQGDPITCWDCHSTSNWDSNFNHDNTNFPLTGAHVSVNCQDCHVSGFPGTPTECFACHETNFNNTTNPNHQALQISTNCTDCHTTNPGWSPAQFPQHSQVFELLGAHANIANCDDCHNGNYNSTPNTCFDCHNADYNGTNDPPHQSLNFPNDCMQCHNMNGWTPATFDHSFYPTGNHHNNVNCNECHSQSNYDPQCLSCHQGDFNEGHNQGDPTDCWACHSTSNWDSNFNHNNTNFPLTGAHVALNCLDCHANGYAGTPTECFACHETTYNNTTNPNHQALQLSTNCNDCHTTDPGWSPAQFPQHSQVFELLGAHANITDCNDCHNGNYNNPPNTCIGCHSSNYNNTTDPPHQSLNFPQDCLQCHNMNGWTPATFDHSFYPTGNHHSNVNCNQCHSQSNYDPQCLSCHQGDFNEGHNSGDPTTCWDCHSTSNWGNAAFDHNNTNFPLTGAHVALNCLDCHANGYAGTPTECFACHETFYNNTTNPDHQALQLSTNCTDCHSTDPGWSPAQFPQHSQFFELLGAHANITDCNDCHNGNFNNPPSTCIGCHSTEYNSTTDPPHQTLNFSQNCLDCHNMNGWTPASFNHNFYPTGNHHNNVNCNQCHSESNYQPQCLSCHYDDFLEGHNSGHSTDCWNCHSTSHWGDAPIPKINQRLD